MKLSFDDEESLKEAVESICFKVIRTHLSEREVCSPRTPRGTRIFVLMIPQVIRIYLAEWEVLVVALLLNLTGDWLYKKKILPYVLLASAMLQTFFYDKRWF